VQTQFLTIFEGKFVVKEFIGLDGGVMESTRETVGGI
jgi:hypothetical protein